MRPAARVSPPVSPPVPVLFHGVHRGPGVAAPPGKRALCTMSILLGRLGGCRAMSRVLYRPLLLKELEHTSLSVKPKMVSFFIEDRNRALKLKHPFLVAPGSPLAY